MRINDWSSDVCSSDLEKSLAADGGKASIRYQATGLACDISLPLAGRVSLRDASPMQNRNTDGHTLSAKPTASAAPQRRARILLIEDEPLIAMDMCDTLEEDRKSTRLNSSH